MISLEEWMRALQEEGDYNVTKKCVEATVPLLLLLLSWLGLPLLPCQCLLESPVYC